MEPYLGDGWSIAEGWGRWSEGGQSEIALCWNSPKNLTISVAAIPHFVYGKQQSVMIYYNDNLVETYLFPENVDGIQQISFRVPATLVSGRLDVIRFVYGYAISPMELGVNDDRRLLAVGFLNMHISAEP